MELALFDDMHRMEREHWWFRARREIIAQVIRATVPPGASVLDVGCGTGFVLEELQRDYDVHGLDAAEVAVRYCQERGLRNVRRGELSVENLASLGLPTLDLVLFLDVLEHLDDDLAALRAARAALRPGGLLLATVPAYQWLWSEHDVIHHHRRRYTRAQLEAVVGAAGFSPVYGTYFNTLLFPAIALARGVSRLRPAEHASAAQMPGPLVNRLLYGLFSAERRLLPAVSLPCGVSILCLARLPS